MNLSVCNIAWDSADDKRIFSCLNEYGVSGIEIAPTRLFPSEPYLHIQDVSKWARNLKNTYGLSVPSIQSILYGRNENIFSNEEERTVLLQYLKESICFSQAAGAGNIVFGCPRNRDTYHLGDISRNYHIAIDFFYELGEYAFEHNTTIGLEANPEIYHTDFLNFTEDTIRFIEAVSSDGVKLNLDVGTMIFYDEPLYVLKGKGDLINHVHISEIGLKKIIPRSIHNDLRDFLWSEDYKGFISIEMGRMERINDLIETIEYVRGIFG